MTFIFFFLKTLPDFLGGGFNMCDQFRIRTGQLPVAAPQLAPASLCLCHRCGLLNKPARVGGTCDSAHPDVAAAVGHICEYIMGSQIDIILFNPFATDPSHHSILSQHSPGAVAMQSCKPP